MPDSAIGHNRTLADQFADLNATIPEYLASQYTHLTEQAEALRSEFTVSVPGSVDDDDTEKAMTDLGARINTFLGLCEGQRKVNKELPAKAPKLIDEFFKSLSGALSSNLETLRSKVNAYKNQKLEAERRRQAEERARVLAAQQEAERQQREALRLRREAEEARIREAESAAAEARPAEPTPEELSAKEAEREADARVAASQQSAVFAPPPIAPMVKAESGAKSGQIGRWTAKIENRDILDLEALRIFIPFSDLEKAANAFARQYKGTRQLTGARIAQEFTTTFRS